MRINGMPQGIKEYTDVHRRRKKWLTAVTCLAAVVVFCTTYALILPAITLEKSVYCGQIEHTHTEECYEAVLICGQDENGDDIHAPGCYEERQVLICGQEETEGHTHTEECYGTEQVLICGQEETEGHIHTEECYGTEQVLICGQEETEGHTHTEECYGTEQVLICGQEETEGHIHTEECYGTEQVLICGQEETEGHTHTEECYGTEQVLICGQEEAEAHIHTEECYGTEQVLICGQEETESPADSQGCYDEEGNLICGQEEAGDHTHSEACYEWVLTCGLEEHTHTEECYIDVTAEAETAADEEATLSGTLPENENPEDTGSCGEIMTSLSELYDMAQAFGEQAGPNDDLLTLLCLEVYQRMSDLMDQAYSLADVTHEELDEVDERCLEILSYMQEAYGFDPYGVSTLAIEVDEIKQKANQTLGTGNGGLGWLSYDDTLKFDAADTALWKTDLGLEPYAATDDSTDSTEPDLGELLPGSAGSDSDGGTAAAAGKIWYTVKYDNAMGGYYREYHVYTADQLHAVLYGYGNSGRFNTYLKATVGTGGDLPSEVSVISKLGIVLESNLDLGGSQGVMWIGYKNTAVTLDLNGNGYTIYNGYFPSEGSAFLGEAIASSASNNPAISGDKYFSIHDVTFEAMYIGQDSGLFGRSVSYAYFYNVNFENCLSHGAANNSSTAVVLGYGYTHVYMKDCMIINSHTIGGSHSSLFASYNGGLSYNASMRMIGEGEADFYYYGSVPGDGEYSMNGVSLTSLEAVEAAWNRKTVTLGETQYLMGASPSDASPSIYEDCGTVDCGLYVINATANHSGGFVSCSQGGTIFRNCFSTTDCYCSKQCGVFLGAVIGSGNGFYYPDVCEDEECGCAGAACTCGGDCACETSVLTNIVFESCWTSGSIEGSSRIGGFVGMIFDDFRFAQSGTRGHAVFQNCYSTSSVGMEYSGSYVGGFCGIIIGNLAAENASNGDRAVQHVFKNCYAAGEVGGIATDTDESSTSNTIGGFFGMYVNSSVVTATNSGIATTVLKTIDGNTIQVISESSYNNVARMYNCYYDKQTTAMRERDIGASDTSYWNGKTALAGTIPGLTGVYTQASEQKRVKGLTNTPQIMGASAEWTYYAEYYPITSGTLNYSYKETGNTRIHAMYAERQAIFHYYSLASAATVFLDHYDEILSDGTNVDTDGAEIPAGTVGKTGDTTVYDTIRDITRKFTFTSVLPEQASVQNLQWQTSADRNEASGFYSTLGGASDSQASFRLTWAGVTDEGTDSSAGSAGEDGSGNVTASYNPNVLTVYQDGNTWKCVDFAPGKQWVNVSVTGGGITGTRYLRLLPSAYLNAGGIISVDVTVDEDDMSGEEAGQESRVDNSVRTYVPDSTASSGWQLVTTDRFYHYLGVAYAITDRTRQDSETAEGSIYNGQVLTLATANDSDEEAVTDSSSFAFYSGYLRTGDSTRVRLADDGGMWSQAYRYQYQANEADSTRNLSTDGSTIVRIYEAVDQSEGEGVPDGNGGIIITLTQGEEITDGSMLAKFEGKEAFQVGDVGFYYMIYQWRLNDGRYLEDVKLVQVTSEAYTVTMVTGIRDEIHTVSDNGYTAIDQYVDLTGAADGGSGKYPSDGADYAAQYRDYYDDESQKVGYSYNKTVSFASGSYGVKSVTKVQTGLATVAGWKNDNNYRLVSVIMEANDGTGWQEVNRIDFSTDTDPDSFNQAVDGMIWKYTYTSYEATQDPEYKTYTVVRFDDSTKYLTISGGSRVEGTAGEEESDGGDSFTEYYIILDFSVTTGDAGTGSSGTTAISSGQKNIRITALYEQTASPISIYKGDQYDNPVKDAVFAAYQADSSYQYQAETETGTEYISLAGCQQMETAADVETINDSYYVDPATGDMSVNLGGTFYTVKAAYVGKTDSSGSMIFMEDGLYLNANALQEKLGEQFILREIQVPEGYRVIAEEAHLYFSNGILLAENVAENGHISGTSVSESARVTATQKLYTGILAETDEWAYPEVTYADNSKQFYYDINETTGEVTVNGMLFAVVLKKNGATGWVDQWYPVYGSDAVGYTVSEESSVTAAIQAAQKAAEYGSVVFTPNSEVDIGFTGMEIYLTNLPGDVTEYVTYQWEMAENPTIDAICKSAEYFVAYYYTTASALEDATAENTVRVVSRDGVITSDNSTLVSGYPGFDIAWGATVSISNYENRVYFQKVNESGDYVNGAAFALYQVGADETGAMYYIADSADAENGAKEYHIYLSRDTDGINRGTAVIKNSSGEKVGTYVIKAGSNFGEGSADGFIAAGSGYGVITITTTDEETTYTITPVQVGYTHDSYEEGTGYFTGLSSGYYAMREIYAPQPYALNPAEVQIYIDDEAVYANAGTADDGVKVGKGPGYLATSMSSLASMGEIDNTLTWILTLLQVSEAKGFTGLRDTISQENWRYATSEGSDIYGTAGSETTEDIAKAMVTYLNYDYDAHSSIFNYSATGVKGGTRGGEDRETGTTSVTPAAAQGARNSSTTDGEAGDGQENSTTGMMTGAGEGSRRLYTETGWSRLAIYQDYYYGSERTQGSSKTYMDLSGEGDISALFSRSTFIVVTDPIRVDLEIDKIGANSGVGLAGAEFLLSYRDGSSETYYYSYDEDAETSSWTKDREAADILSSAGERQTGGEAVYQLIQVYGLTPRIYYLTETKAPDGYRPLEEDVAIMVDSDGTVSMSYGGITYTAAAKPISTSWTVKRKADDPDADTYYTWTLTVPNYDSYQLPATGGMGTRAFMEAGLALLFSAGAGWIVRRRKHRSIPKKF